MHALFLAPDSHTSLKSLIFSCQIRRHAAPRHLNSADLQLGGGQILTVSRDRFSSSRSKSPETETATSPLQRPPSTSGLFAASFPRNFETPTSPHACQCTQMPNGGSGAGGVYKEVVTARF